MLCVSAQRQRHCGQVTEMFGKHIIIAPSAIFRDMWNMVLRTFPLEVDAASDQAKHDGQMETT